MFAQRSKTWYNEGKKYYKHKPLRNLDHINYNDCGEKENYASNYE